MSKHTTVSPGFLNPGLDSGRFGVLPVYKQHDVTKSTGVRAQQHGMYVATVKCENVELEHVIVVARVVLQCAQRVCTHACSEQRG